MMNRYLVIDSQGSLELTFKGQIITYTKEKAEEHLAYLIEKNKAKGWGLAFEIIEVLIEDWKI